MLRSVYHPTSLFVFMAIVTTLTEFETFQAQYVPAEKLLCGAWTAPTLDVDIRDHYSEVLAQAQEHGGCRYWLLDLRQRNWHMPSFGQWFSTDFAPTAHAVLGQPLFVAYLLSPRHRAIAESDRAQACQRRCAQHDVYTYYFADEDAAFDWLRHQQALS